MISSAGLAARQRLPGQLLRSSHALGWPSLLARTYDEPAVAEEFATAPAPELLLVVQLAGSYRIESRRARGWVAATYGPGSMGVTAPGASSTLRWRAPAGVPARTLQVHVDAQLMTDTAEALGRPLAADQLPDALAFEDPVVLATGRAIAAAVEHRAGPLVAESLAHALAGALLTGSACGRAIVAPRAPALSAAALARVVDHMGEHLADVVSLQELAALVHTSKYHFLRSFAQATGSTPARYLTRLRMRRAAELLRTTGHPVTEIALVCGYASAGHFANAFRRHHGTTPGRYRRDVQR